MAKTIKKRPAAARKRPASAPTHASYPNEPELPAAASNGDHVVSTFRQALDIDLQEDVRAHARTVYLVTFCRILESTLQNVAHLRICFLTHPADASPQRESCSTSWHIIAAPRTISLWLVHDLLGRFSFLVHVVHYDHVLSEGVGVDMNQLTSTS